ncbi:MAG: hypothetical protein ACUVTD_00300 [Nitrososphaerales archaeon]
MSVSLMLAKETIKAKILELRKGKQKLLTTEYESLERRRLSRQSRKLVTMSNA